MVPPTPADPPSSAHLRSVGRRRRRSLWDGSVEGQGARSPFARRPSKGRPEGRGVDVGEPTTQSPRSQRARAISCRRWGRRCQRST